MENAPLCKQTQLRAIVGYESSGDKVGTSINGLIVPPTGLKKKDPRRSLVIELERMYWTMKLVSLVDKQRLTLSGSSSGIIRKRRYCFLSVRKISKYDGNTTEVRYAWKMQREIPKLYDLKEKIIILLLDASISSNLVKLESLDERRGNAQENTLNKFLESLLVIILWL